MHVLRLRDREGSAELRRNSFAHCPAYLRPSFSLRPLVRGKWVGDRKSTKLVKRSKKAGMN